MKRPLAITTIATCAFTLGAQATTTIQEWNFTEDGGGIANNVSEQLLNSQFFDSPDPVASDGGVTVQRGNGFGGDRPLGLTLNDSNAKSVTLSITLTSYDFTAGTTDTSFGVRLRNDANDDTIGEIQFKKQDSQSRMRLIANGNVAGVALGAESGSSSFTYGTTLDFENDTYTSWIGTPASDGSTWVSRFANHTSSIAGLGSTTNDVDSIQFFIANHTSGNQFVIDQIQVSYDVVPEPSSAALLGLGGLALILRRRKQGPIHTTNI